MIGKTFGGRYSIQEKIASGGMAEVYRAHDITLNRTVAVKILYSRYAAEAGFVARFRREAQAAANLNHPNIVNIYDWGSEDSTYYIVMEFITGRTLKDIIAEQAPMDEPTIINIGRQVAAALSHAHSHNLIHRDIKPHNIIITEDGKVKVTDFGIARSTTSTMTQTGSILGTANYLSPEQAQGNEVGSVSDIYSLGIVLFEMATGQVPFTGDSPVAIALKHIHEAPPLPRRLNPNLPVNLQEVIVKAISKHPSDRYQSAEELSEDLGRCAKGLPIAPASAGGAETIVIPRISAAKKVEEKEEEPEKPSRRKLAWIIAAIVIAILLIGGIAGGLFYINSTTVRVPDITDLSKTQATTMLAKKKLKLSVTDSVFNAKYKRGRIIQQSPEPDAKLRTGSTVKVVISKGREKVAVPKLIGITLDQATFFLAKSNLNVGNITREYNNDAAASIVIGQDPPLGTKVLKETSIDLKVSKGPTPIRVPDVVGKAAAEAEAIIGQRKLTPAKTDEFNDTIDAGKVIRESPQAGTIIKRGGTVNIVVSKGPEKIDVPDVSGMNKNDAKTTLESLGFVVTTNTSIASPANFDKVVNQDPAAGDQANKGSTVVIWIGVSP